MAGGLLMPLDKSRLPDPRSHYETQGLKLGKGKTWASTECRFHGGSDSMRINLKTGAFVCMAGCGARGGDVLAYHMAAHGLGFVEAAKALGCWIEDGLTPPVKPAPFSPRQALEVLASEANLIAIAAGNIANGIALNEQDHQRVMQAAGRILKIQEVFG